MKKKLKYQMTPNVAMTPAGEEEIQEEIKNADFVLILGEDEDNASFIAANGLMQVRLQGYLVDRRPVTEFIDGVAGLDWSTDYSQAIMYSFPPEKRATLAQRTVLNVERSGRRGEFLYFSYQSGGERFDAYERCGSLFARMVGIDD